MCTSTCGLVAMTSASHAEGRQFDPGQVYWTCQSLLSLRSLPQKHLYKAFNETYRQSSQLVGQACRKS